MIPEMESDMHFGWTFYVVIIGGIFQVVGTGLMMNAGKERESIEVKPVESIPVQDDAGIDRGSPG